MSQVTLEASKVKHAAEQALKIITVELEANKKSFEKSFRETANKEVQGGWFKRHFGAPQLDIPTLDKLSHEHITLHKKQAAAKQMVTISELGLPVTIGAFEAEIIKDYLGE